MTRDDLARFRALDINFDSIGLLQGREDDFAYFCTPEGAEFVGALGCDGVHFVLLPGEETVYCVDPFMGGPGTYVLPVGRDFRQFLSFVLFCRDANPLSQIYWLSEEHFRDLLAEDAGEKEHLVDFFAEKDAACAKIAEIFGLSPVDPYGAVRAMQEAFDPGVLHFSDEYYNVLGIERE